MRAAVSPHQNPRPLLPGTSHLLTALYVELTDRIIPSGGFTRPAVTAKRSACSDGPDMATAPAHSRWYWGAKLLLICTCDGTVTGFGLANPKLCASARPRHTILK